MRLVKFINRCIYSRRSGNESGLTGLFANLSCHLTCLLFLLQMGWTLGAAAAEPANTLKLIPDKISLSGPAAYQQLLIERWDGQHLTGQLTNGIKIRVSDPKVVRVDGNTVLPITNGTAQIVVTVGTQTASAEVEVSGMQKTFEWSFRNHVQPVLARMGCSSGACHGAAAGQNGFKISLRGYDNEGDYLSLTHHAFGRRIVPSDPGRSLLLLKPTGAVPHKGGTKFDTASLEYRVLSEWIAAGTPPPKTNDPRIVRIEVLPEQVVVKPGMSQQLVVRAHFNDGHSEDVTRWAKYTSANESVAQVNEQGTATVSGYGEGAVTAWYLSRIAIAIITAPYTNTISSETFASAPRRNFIDDLILEKLKSLNLPPSPRCSDEEFIRRVFLDTVGVLPTVQETREFLENQSAGKRDDLIQRLLKRTEFVDYWTYKWADLLLVQSRKLKPAAMWSYYNWIRNNVAANTPWNEIVRQVVTSQGSTLENGAANFFVLHEDPKLMAETTSQAFLGMSINCARCHNHPMEKWTNDEYFGFANLFARLRSKTGSRDGENIIFASASGDVVQPLTGKPQPPRPLEGKPLPIDATSDRRQALADWLVSAENPYFSRAVVNRVWANFFGVGLVENVDDLRVTNPASNEKLLSATAKYLAGEKFDLKVLIRTILESEAYQRTSTALPGNATDHRFYSRYYPRRLTAEVLLDTLSEATGAPTKFKGYPETWRALQLPDSNVDSYFLKTFGRPDREKTCECERSTEPSVTQVLHMSNGDTVNQKLSAKKNRITQLIADKTPPEKIIEEAYLSSLSRYPSPREKERFLKSFGDVAEKDRRPLIEDVFWALLTSKEFLFNH
ncbi:MAG: hypothetical protein JWM16_4477 [Verrucomicrobiales bacterium]|nr:hypothetical protein [Verrucomicrobiales bacterium]